MSKGWAIQARLASGLVLPLCASAVAAVPDTRRRSPRPWLVGRRDPKTGENFYLIKKGSPYGEGGTAEEHLKGEPPNTMIVSYRQVAGRPDMPLRVEHNFAKR